MIVPPGWWGLCLWGGHKTTHQVEEETSFPRAPSTGLNFPAAFLAHDFLVFFFCQPDPFNTFPIFISGHVYSHFTLHLQHGLKEKIKLLAETVMFAHFLCLGLFDRI